jgi:hypothetical protein
VIRKLTFREVFMAGTGFASSILCRLFAAVDFREKTKLDSGLSKPAKKPWMTEAPIKPPHDSATTFKTLFCK